MMKPTRMTMKAARCLVLLSASTIASAAVEVRELTVRPAIAAASSDQQIALLQQQVQALQAQLAVLQAVVQITPATVAGQEPSVTIAAGVVPLGTSGLTVPVTGQIVNGSQNVFAN